MNLFLACRLAVVSLSLAACSTLEPDRPWPKEVVRIEQLRLTKTLRTFTPAVIRWGELKGPCVVRAHVGTDGSVQRVALMDSSGSPAHDDAALRAMRSAQFQPVTVGGTPIEVTLVVPLRFPY